MTSSVLSLAYFTHFSNLNVSNADISEGYILFLTFSGILCDKPSNSTDFNLIVVALKGEVRNSPLMSSIYH